MSNKNILKIYTAPHCIKCRMVKKYCERHQIEYVAIDSINLSNEELDMLAKWGLQETPILNMGEAWSAGFDIQFLEGAKKSC